MWISWNLKTDGFSSVFRSRRLLESQIIGRVWSFRDVTESKKAVKTLKESEERYRTLLENVEDGYYEVDLNGNYIFCNEAYAKILGYGPQELIGLNFRGFTRPETAEKVYQIFHSIFDIRSADQKLGRGDGPQGRHQAVCGIFGLSHNQCRRENDRLQGNDAGCDGTEAGRRGPAGIRREIPKGGGAFQ